MFKGWLLSVIIIVWIVIFSYLLNQLKKIK